VRACHPTGTSGRPAATQFVCSDSSYIYPRLVVVVMRCTVELSEYFLLPVDSHASPPANQV
jgi:hypothetical protein